MRTWLMAIGVAVLALGCAGPEIEEGGGPRFTIAMIPDTQNYTDYTHQKAEGFAIDASELFLEQLGWVADHARSRGGDIAFVASVGDTWQHPTKWIDSGHEAIGHERVANPYFDAHFTPSEKVAKVEIPTAIAGYRLVADAGLPFGIPPGNHDYDAMYNVHTHPPDLTKRPEEITFTVEDLGLLHVGGLEGFLGAFGADSEFFAAAPWYVDSFGGGTSSAQVFEAGGYRFLHLLRDAERRGPRVGPRGDREPSGLADDRLDPRLPEPEGDTDRRRLPRLHPCPRRTQHAPADVREADRGRIPDLPRPVRALSRSGLSA